MVKIDVSKCFLVGMQILTQEKSPAVLGFFVRSASVFGS